MNNQISREEAGPQLEFGNHPPEAITSFPLHHVEDLAARELFLYILSPVLSRSSQFLMPSISPVSTAFWGSITRLPNTFSSMSFFSNCGSQQVHCS